MPPEQTGAPAIQKPLDHWLAEIDAASSGGERLRAFDIAEAALRQFPNALPIKYASVLALARAGATQQAHARYRQLGLDRPPGPDVPLPLRINIAALDARIAKDAAMLASGAARIEALRDAAARYNAIFDETGDYYPGINAAALWYLSGDAERAQQIAKAVLAACLAAREEGASYYLAATEAEAQLLLGNEDAAAAALVVAGASGGNLSDLATTRKQLSIICAITGTAPDMLRALRVPTVIHFTGHQVGKRLPSDLEHSIAQRIAATLALHKVGIGYGSLAGGSDILIAEALLQARAELNIVLPFGVDEFKRISVEPSGAAWLNRFDRCVEAARSVEFATTDEFLGDKSLFAYSSQLAMGLALLRASYLGGEARQLAVWDGDTANGEPGEYGTGADVVYWRTRGRQTDVIVPEVSHIQDMQKKNAAPASPGPHGMPRDRRVVRAMLFGDITGFSNLREAQLPIFLREVLGRLSDVLDRYGDRIEYRNSWGDGLFVVAVDAECAASCALDLQQAMTEVDPTRHELSGYSGLRLGAHVGPVFRLYDPVLRRPTFLGVHVSRTARIEPIAPVGAVYVTEAFAASLAIRPNSSFAAEYVGQVSMAKGYGRMRMYSLRRARELDGAGRGSAQGTNDVP